MITEIEELKKKACDDCSKEIIEVLNKYGCKINCYITIDSTGRITSVFKVENV